MDIRVEHPELEAFVADVRRAVDVLATARARASGQVSLLLDGGWTGAAAGAFAAAWDDWLAAAATVTTELDQLAHLLAVVGADFSDTDGLAAIGLDRLAGRLR